MPEIIGYLLCALLAMKGVDLFMRPFHTSGKEPTLAIYVVAALPIAVAGLFAMKISQFEVEAILAAHSTAPSDPDYLSPMTPAAGAPNAASPADSVSELPEDVKQSITECLSDSRKCHDVRR